LRTSRYTYVFPRLATQLCCISWHMLEPELHFHINGSDLVIIHILFHLPYFSRAVSRAWPRLRNIFIDWVVGADDMVIRSLHARSRPLEQAESLVLDASFDTAFCGEKGGRARPPETWQTWFHCSLECCLRHDPRAYLKHVPHGINTRSLTSYLVSDLRLGQLSAES